MAERFPYSIRCFTLPSGEEVPLLVAEDGLPHLLANAHVQALSRNAGRSPSTQDARLRGIGRALAWLRRVDIDIAARVATGDFLVLEELNGLADACRARVDDDTRLINGKTAGHYWDASLEYINWRADAVIGAANGSRKEMLVKQRENFLRLAKRQRPRDTQGAHHVDRMGLAPHLRDRLIEVIRPGASGNPFQPKLQKRNHALILAAYELGFREGEELSLRIRDYDPRQDPPTLLVQPRAPDPDDTRKVKPRVKTRGRLLQPPDNVLDVLDGWLQQRRDRVLFPKARSHPYIFVETSGEPLAMRSLRSIYERLAQVHSELAGLGPHLIRHTAADLDVERAAAIGLSEEQLQRRMEYKFGWCPGSDQPGKYSRGATGRAVNDRLSGQARKDLGLD